MKKIKYLLFNIIGFMVTATDSIAKLNLDKIENFGINFNNNANPIENAKEWFDVILTLSGYFFIIGGISIAALGVFKAITNSQNSIKSEWTVAKSLGYGILVMIIGVAIGVILLSFTN